MIMITGFYFGIIVLASKNSGSSAPLARLTCTVARRSASYRNQSNLLPGWGFSDTRISVTGLPIHSLEISNL